jgi:pimeloyl-ACP methyl ester carboxylesterase
MPYLERDGVKLYYEESGAGEPAMLLVHGWTCNHTHWAAQVEHFSKTHRVVTVDLRGHGLSDAPQQDYSMEGYADDLAWLCGQLGIEKPVVCGHSMGGIVTLVMTAGYPDIVRAAVLVDSPFPPLKNAPDRLKPLIESLSKPDYMGAATSMVESMFSPLDDVGRKAEIMAGMLATPQHVMVESMRSNAATDGIAVGQRINQPMLVISAGHMAFSDNSRLREEFPGVQFAQTFGSGHFNMVEVPEQVNTMIERFLEKYVA